MVKSEIDKELKKSMVTNAGCLKKSHESLHLQWNNQGRACWFYPSCELPAFLWLLCLWLWGIFFGVFQWFLSMAVQQVIFLLLSRRQWAHILLYHRLGSILPNLLWGGGPGGLRCLWRARWNLDSAAAAGRLSCCHRQTWGFSAITLSWRTCMSLAWFTFLRW